MSATYAQIRSKILAAIKVLKYELDSANGKSGNSNDFVTTSNSLNSTALADPDQNASLTKQIAAFRQNRENNLSAEAAFLTPLIDDIAKAIGSRATNVQEQLTDLFATMLSNGDRVLTRTFTRGAFSPGSPCVGNGLVLRIATDSNNLPMEASTPDVFTLKVEADATGATTGSKATFVGRERWRLNGLPSRGYTERGLSGRGSGYSGTFTGTTGDDTVLKNTALSANPTGGDATPTAIPGWNASPALAGDGSDVVIDRTNYYQEFQAQGGTPGAIQLKKAITFTQPFSGSNANANPLSPDNTAPYHWSAAVLGAVPSKTGAAGVLYFGPGSKYAPLVVCGKACAAADSGSAGNPNGILQYVVTFVVNGVESMYSAPASVTVTNHQVNLTAIPLGPSGTIGGISYTTSSRKIYRTTNGGSTFKLLATVAGNVTTTFTDNVTDGSLGATVATANSSVYQVPKIEDLSTPQNQWFVNWNQAAAGFTVSWNPVTGSGPLNVDRVLLCQYDMIPATTPGPNGAGQSTAYPSSFILFLSLAPGTPAGAGAAWLLGDTGTITDTETGSIVQDHLERAFQRYAPAANPAVNWLEP